MGALFVQTNTGTSSYHGVTLELQRRFRDGYGLHASYTTSDAETNVDSLANLSDLPENLDINEYRTIPPAGRAPVHPHHDQRGSR